MREKIESYLGFAAKSRNLISGYNTCTLAMQKGKVRLLLVAEDLAENTAEKILRTAGKSGVSVRRYGTVSQLSQLTGKECAGIYGIVDDNFAKVILKEIEKCES